MLTESRQNRARWALVAMMAAALGIAMRAAAPPRGGHAHATRATVLADDRPECPHTPQFIIIDSVREDDDDADSGDVVVRQRIVEEVPLSGPITDIPEFHDCQRFIVDSAGRDVYGSLYAIYAGQQLEQLEVRIDSVQIDTNSIVAVPAATIYSYGEVYDPGRYERGFYRRLGLSPGFNCLYLWRRPHTVPIQWQAWMLSRGLNDPQCPDSLMITPAIAGITPLRVRPTVAAGEDVPPVARWDWDSAGREQYIGIKCGAAWCEVSDDGTRSQQPAVSIAFPALSPLAVTGAGSASTPRERTRVVGIKGWYDAQRLAHLDSDGHLVPSNVWGVIAPHPTLYRDAFSNYARRWVHVATAMVTNGDYDGSLMTMKAGQEYRIHLCIRDCPDLPETLTCQMPGNALRMWSMITYVNDRSQPDTIFRCVARRTPGKNPHPPVPGTARWRWLANDETTWKRCSEGCCEVQ